MSETTAENPQIILGDMSMDQLVALQHQIEAELLTRKTGEVKLSQVLIRGNNTHTRIAYAMYSYFGISIDAITLAKIAEALTVTQMKKIRNMGDGSIRTLRTLLNQHGYSLKA